MVHATTCTCSETSAIRDASFAAMKRCNSRIKNYYDTHLSEDLRTNYCDGMQFLANCAKEELQKFKQTYGCTSDVLQKWLFVSLQYYVIGDPQHLGICNYNTEPLRNLVDNSCFGSQPNYQERKISGVLIPEREKLCAKRIHAHCAKPLVEDSDLCNGVNEFVDCYENIVDNFSEQREEVDTLEVPCARVTTAPGISKKFRFLISAFSRYLIERYRGDASLAAKMCHVDPDDLDDK